MQVNGNNGNGNGKRRMLRMSGNELMSHPLLPPGYYIPTSRKIHASKRMRELLRTESLLVGPAVCDPMGAKLAMNHGFKVVYFSLPSFAAAYLGTTDMDLCSGVEIADVARRTVSALRKFQLTAAVGDPETGVPPRSLHIPPVVADVNGVSNISNIRLATELYVGAGLAAAQIDDQVLPRGSNTREAMIPHSEIAGKLKMARVVADDCGNLDFVIIARTGGLGALDEPGSSRGLDRAVERALRYLDSGIPDMVGGDLPRNDHAQVERFCWEVRKRFPKAIFGFNWSSSLSNPEPLRFSELADIGVKFILVTLGAQANRSGLNEVLQGMAEGQTQAFTELQPDEWAADARSHAQFSDETYRRLVGKMFGAGPVGNESSEELAKEKVV